MLKVPQLKYLAILIKKCIIHLHRLLLKEDIQMPIKYMGKNTPWNHTNYQLSSSENNNKYRFAKFSYCF